MVKREIIKADNRNNGELKLRKKEKCNKSKRKRRQKWLKK